jgi:diguanylate cyclase (GGDEF)-like protein/PAS domain S-box-containing protein
MAKLAPTADFPRDDLCVRITQLESALDNMPQALCMFDAERRLILSNRLYADIFGLPPELTKPGTSLLDILRYRVAAELVPGGDGPAYIRERLEIVDRDSPSKSLLELKDGRVFSVVHEPMAGGGWVATHEDITKQTQIDRDLARVRASLIEARNEAERVAEQARSAHQRLLDAFEVVPEALIIMDDQDRLVLWNRRYEELYSEPIELRTGMTFEESLRLGLAKKQFLAAAGREEAWLAERLAHHAAPRSQHEHEMCGGRWVRIEEQRTADGGSIGIRIDITELKQRQDSIRLLFDSNPVPMWVFDRETLRFLAVNDAALEHYGYGREQFLAMTILDIRSKEEWEVVRAYVGREWTYENGGTFRHKKADGSEILIAAYARSITYEGRKGRLVSVIDVTERMRVKNDLRRAREFLNLVIESIPDVVIVRDVHERRVTMLNRAAEDFLGMPRSDVVGKTAEEMYPAEFAKVVRKEDDELLRTGELFIDNHPMELRGNGPRIVTLNRKLLKDGNGAPEYMLTVIRDITERKRAEERITHLARHDQLTDLPNRTAFNERLAAALNRAEDSGLRFAVLCIDLDRLKEVNDILGHAAGDMLLCEVSRRLREASGDLFLARLGGDEFVQIAEDAGPTSNIVALTDRLLAAVAVELDIQGVKIHASLSIGVAIFPDDGRDTTTLLANADAALYRAKAEGRGVTRFFELDMDKRQRERHAMRHDLSTAIERGEFAMFYQPQAEVTGEIVGFEALLRWRHPLRGSVPPSAFIPVAEDNRLIVRIGEWVLREVCREAASWPRALGVAVNLSPVQFQHGDLPGLVHSILLETGLSPSRLELEITEGVLMDDSSCGLSVLRRLKSLGVRIAMDDFGKGYSSLSYLQSFPFDKIKIDRAFVSKVARNPQSAAIVRAVLGLAHGLGLPVLAEGVETEEELAFLAAEACDQVQGYLIGRPRPINDYAEVIGRKPASAELETRDGNTGLQIRSSRTRGKARAGGKSMN